MLYRSDPNLIPGIGFTLMVLLIILAFQGTTSDIGLPLAANADPRPPQSNEIVLRVHAGGWMELSVDDEWGSTVRWGTMVESPYRQPDSLARLERTLIRLYANHAEDRILVLKADTAVEFGVIEQAMAVARRAGVRVVAAITERRGR